MSISDDELIESLHVGVELMKSGNTQTRLKADDSLSLSLEDCFNVENVGNSFKYSFSVPDITKISRCNVNGKTIFPASGFLVLVWHTSAKQQNKNLDELPIIFEKVYFHKTLEFDGTNQLVVTILPGLQDFEVTEKDIAIVSGTVRFPADIDSEMLIIDPPVRVINNELLPLTANDIYKELAIRGYYYTGLFHGIRSSNLFINTGILQWNNDWVSFINTMLQFDLARMNTEDLYLPSELDRVIINPKGHQILTLGYKNKVQVRYIKDVDVVVAGAVQVVGPKWRLEPRIHDKCHDLMKKKDQLNGQNNQEVKHVYLVVATTGDLSSLRWVENPLHLHNKSPDGELCYVYYSSLNYRDLIRATGRQLPHEQPQELNARERGLGIEFSGRTKIGKRVMGIVQSRGLASTVLAKKPFYWEVPPNWTLNAAATVPVAYVTAYYALFVRAQIKTGESILVYCGASDVGSAVITLAVHAGCKIYSAENCQDQKQYISSRYLEVPKSDVFYDWQVAHEKYILEKTKGIGVDVVVNILGSNKIKKGMRCLAKGGRFLQIKLMNHNENTNLNLLTFDTNKSFHSIEIECMSDADKEIVARYISEGIKKGDVVPIRADNYRPEQLKEAFGLLITGKQIGKVTIQIRDEEKEDKKIAEDMTMNVIYRSYMDPNKTYIIIGDIDGLAMVLGKWLVSRGATKLVFNIGNVVKGYQFWCIQRLKDVGVKVLVLSVDASTSEGAEKLFEEANSLGPVGGVFDFTATINDVETSKSDLSKSSIEIVMEQNREDGSPGFVVRLGRSDEMGTEIDNETFLKTLPQRIESFLQELDIKNIFN